jgi:hypothetical protein
MSKQKRKVEWTFDFEDLGSRVNQFFGDVMGGDFEVETADLDVMLDDTQSATVRVDFSVGRANVIALPNDSDKLFAAHITYVGEYEFDVTGGEEKQVTLKQLGRFPRGLGKVMGNSKDLIWDISLHPSVAYDLRLKGGVGETDIDLTNLNIKAVKLDTGVGKMAVTLPIQSDPITASINGGVGETEVIVPAGTTGNVDINGGVGEVTVSIDPNTAIRIDANAGLGDINLPKVFEKISGRGSFVGVEGVWETPNFATAERQLVIDYNGGIGSFKLKFFELV